MQSDHLPPSERRPQSHRGRLASTRIRSSDLQYLIRGYPLRWSAAALAAALTLPADHCGSVEAWARLLDRLDDAIRAIVAGG